MQIADRYKIELILDRLAYQIAENHHDKKSIVLVGIQESGLVLADEVALILKKIVQAKIQVVRLEINKKKPSKGSFNLTESSITKEDVVILVDDVINSGRTLFYSLRVFLDTELSIFQTLILVERKYKRFPIHADYVGISLNTTLKEHIEVKLMDHKLFSIELN